MFSAISAAIKSRRTIKPFMMNGARIADEQVAALLELADWAPNHGFTEPWRFVVYAEPAVFCHQHAALYQQSTDADSFNPGVYQNLFHQGDKASHVIVTLMHRGNLPKIPVWEEVAAVSCAVQNLMLGATALNIASFWSTGGMALKPEMKAQFNLREEDLVIGVIYLGYTDETPQAPRKIPLSEKITWIS